MLTFVILCRLCFLCYYFNFYFLLSVTLQCCNLNLYTTSWVQWKNQVWVRVNKWKIPVRGKNNIDGKLQPVCGRVLQWNCPWKNPLLTLIRTAIRVQHALTLSRSKKHFPCQEDFWPCTSRLWSGIQHWALTVFPNRKICSIPIIEHQ